MRNCRVVDKLVLILLNDAKKPIEINYFVTCRSSFLPLFPLVSLSANHDIWGLAQSLVVVKEKILKRNSWEWQKQRSCNRRTVIILHIWKKITSVLLWQDHCVTVCCTLNDDETHCHCVLGPYIQSDSHTHTHTNTHTHIYTQGRIGLKKFVLFSFNYLARKLSNVSICFIESILKPQFFSGNK